MEHKRKSFLNELRGGGGGGGVENDFDPLCVYKLSTATTQILILVMELSVDTRGVSEDEPIDSYRSVTNRPD